MSLPVAGLLFRTKIPSIACLRLISLSNNLRTVEHDAENQRFTMKLPMDTAYVGYFPSNNALNLYSIFVPKRYREIGIGQELAQDVLEYCAEHNLQVILSCPYLITFYKQHPYPKFKNIVKGIAAPKTTEIRPNDSDNN